MMRQVLFEVASAPRSRVDCSNIRRRGCQTYASKPVCRPSLKGQDMDAQAASAVSRKGAPAGPIRTDLSTLLRLAGPVVFSRLGIMTMGLTDAIVVGRYSPVQLA